MGKQTQPLLFCSDLVFLIAPSSSVAKHAVDSLEDRDQNSMSDRPAHCFDPTSTRIPPARATTVTRADEKKRTPMLVFSSETVLDRQSFQLDRRPSLELEVTDDPFPAIGLPLRGDYDNDRGGRYHPQSSAGKVLDAATLEPLTASTATTSASPALGSSRLRSMSPPFHVDAVRRLHGHILICGPFDQGHQLACYLDDLYASEGLPSRPDIMLLVNSLPSDREIAAMPRALPSDVFVEHGASQNVEELLRVRAFDASTVLIVPSDRSFTDNSEDIDEHLQDYQAVMSTLSLRTMQELHHEHLRQKQAAMDPDAINSDSPNVRLLESKLFSSRCSVVKSMKAHIISRTLMVGCTDRMAFTVHEVTVTMQVP